MEPKKQRFLPQICRAPRVRQWLAALMALILLVQTLVQNPLLPIPVYAATTSTQAATASPADLKGTMWMTYKWHTSTGYNWTGLESDLVDISNAGIGWVRLGIFESTPLSFYDRLIPLIAKYHIKVLATLHKSYPEKDLGTSVQQTAYRAWVAQLVTRYKSTILAWEIQNEENLPQEWTIDGSAGGDPVAYSQSVANYVSLLRQAYITIKAIDPSLRVLLGGLSEANAEKYVGELIKQNAYQYFDIFGFHPYGSNPLAVVSRVNSIKAKMAQQASLAAKPIWITEIGYNTKLSWTTGGMVATEEIKADFLLQTMQMLSDIPGVQRPIFWYTFSENSATAGFGLVYKDQKQTPIQTQYLPAYDAYKYLWVSKFVRIETASEDSFVSKNYPTANYGSTNILRVGYGGDVRKAFLKFDLTGLAGYTLQKVQLGFLVANQVDAGSATAQTIQMLSTTSWTETGINNVNQLTPVVGYISHTSQARGYQVTLDPAGIQLAAGGWMSLAIDSHDADELVIQSREWASSPPRLIIYYTPATASAATVEQANTPAAEAMEMIQPAPALFESQMIEIPQISDDSDGIDEERGNSEPSPQIYLPDVQR